MRTLRFGVVELFFALIVLNTGLLALMSAFQHGDFHMQRGGNVSAPNVQRVVPQRASLTLRALERANR